MTLFGRGGHGSSPEKITDPVVMAAATVMRLQIVVSREIGLTVNDEDANRKVADALRQRLGAERVGPIGPASASEDFSVILRAWGDVPSVYWIVGGVDP